MKNTIKTNLFFLFITSVAMFLSGWMILFLLQNFPGHYKKLNEFQPVNATVSDTVFLESNGSRRSRTSKYQITYSYSFGDVNYQKSEIYLKNSAFQTIPQKGDQIVILLNPNNIEDVRIKPKAPLLTFIFAFGSALIIFLGAGWVWLRTVKRLGELSAGAVAKKS